MLVYQRVPRLSAGCTPILENPQISAYDLLLCLEDPVVFVRSNGSRGRRQLPLRQASKADSSGHLMAFMIIYDNL